MVCKLCFESSFYKPVNLAGIFMSCKSPSLNKLLTWRRGNIYIMRKKLRFSFKKRFVNTSSQVGSLMFYCISSFTFTSERKKNESMVNYWSPLFSLPPLCSQGSFSQISTVEMIQEISFSFRKWVSGTEILNSNTPPPPPFTKPWKMEKWLVTAVEWRHCGLENDHGLCSDARVHIPTPSNTFRLLGINVFLGKVRIIKSRL